jgi:Tfp pilus assembly protein PilF
MMHWHAYQWADAEAEFRKTIAADSTSPVAHTQYGRFLATEGKLNDALREFRTARALDPLAPTASMWVSHTLSFLGDHSAAWEESKRARELDPDLFTSRTLLSQDRIATGNLDDARAIVGEEIRVTPFDGMGAYVLQLAGDTARAAAVWRELHEKSDTTWMIHSARAYEYLAIRDTSRALSELDSAVNAGEIVPQQLMFVERSLDGVRQSGRFAAIVRRVGLDPRTFAGPTGGRPAR